MLSRKLMWRWDIVAVLSVVFFFAGQAVRASEEPLSRILVTGEGKVDIAPDMAVLTLTVMREAATAQEAVTANSAAMAEVLDAMASLDIDQRDLQTTDFSIQSKYAAIPQGGAEVGSSVVGYTVRNTLRVRVRDIRRVGDVLDTSITLGVNEGGNILFTNEDPAAAITQARIQAVEDAMARGRTLAQAAGVAVGRVLEISEQNYSPRPVSMARTMVAMEGVGSVPVAAGETSYKVVVSISLAIEQ